MDLAQTPPPTQPQTQPTPDTVTQSPITNQERSSLLITSTDLDLHLIPSESRLESHATITLLNTSATLLTRIPIQISGSLRWQGIAAATPKGISQIPFTQSPIATDTDHTGLAQEAILTLAQPLAPNAIITISAFYAGPVTQTAARLTLLGTDPARAAQSDWDAIAPTTDVSATALRGFGDVLWYPVAAPTAALGEGNRLFDLIASQRHLLAPSLFHLRLTVEYLGDPPDSAIFNGNPQPLARLPDADDQLVNETHGIATADFPAGPLGLRTPSLFLTAQHAIQTPGQLLSVISPNPEFAEPYATAATQVQALLSTWLGPTPTSPVTLLDHPGAPFEDEAFLATSLSANATPEAVAAELVRPLTHASFAPQAPTTAWLAEGLPEFMSLLWTEKTQGREAAVAQLTHNATLIALASPDLSARPPQTSQTNPPGQPLTDAYSDIYLRLKSAAVLWQLREILGHDPTGNDLFRPALVAFRRSLALNPTLDRNPKAFELSLERTTGRELAWFFSDWVYRDRGLPDLTIAHIAARAERNSKTQLAGYLVAVEVSNEGDAIAEVPVTVRSARTSAASNAQITERLRIPAHASASVRIFFQGTPDNVEVNDGTTPELRTSTHTAQIVSEPAR